MSTVTETRHRFTVARADDRARLDRLLADLVPAHSRSRLKTLIETGRVSIAGETITEPGYRVKPGQMVTLVIPPPSDETPQAQAIPLTIAYEDDPPDRGGQARGPGRPPGAGQSRPYARQRAPRPLRREPLRHRRGAAARYRPPPGQGHQRPPGGGQARRRTPRTCGSVRHAAAEPDLPGGGLGPAAARHRGGSKAPSAAIPAIASGWRCARAAASPRLRSIG